MKLPMPMQISASPVFIDLPGLISQKIGSYLSNRIHRLKDLSDVVELMKANKLPADLPVAPEVQAEYRRVWAELAA